MIWISTFFLVASLAGLILSGELLVAGALRLSRVLQVSPLIVGLTIVAFGTSAPELFVAVQAVQNAAEGVALGNIIGSNIANVLLVLGVPALIVTIKTAHSETEKDTVIMLIATGLFCVVAYGTGGISLTVGIGFVACILGYLIYTALRSRKHNDSSSDCCEAPVKDRTLGCEPNLAD